MQSEHPGGWEDIVAFMDEKKILIPDERGRTVSPGEIIKTRPPGEAAAMICRALMAHGWYVPGDPKWKKPCSEWTHQYHLTQGK